MNLQGKIAVVTDGAMGNGKGIVESFGNTKRKIFQQPFHQKKKVSFLHHFFLGIEKSSQLCLFVMIIIVALL